MPVDGPSPVLVESNFPTETLEQPAADNDLTAQEKYNGTSEYLPYHLGYLPEVMKQMAERELHETDERKEISLKKFRKIIAAEKNLYVRTDDLCLLAYLRGKKYDVDRAWRSMKNTYKLRMKKHFYDSDDNSSVHDVFRQNWVGFLPYRAQNGSVILVIRGALWDPEKVDRDLLMWVITHCMIHSIEDEATQVAGYSAIIDVRGMTNKHLKLLTLENILLIIHSVLYCFPGRYKAAHIIGMPKFFAYAWNMIYPFILTLKLRKRIFIHGENLSSLHKHLSPAILPQEYEGELGPFDNSAWHASILQNNEWCLGQRHFGYKK